MLKYLPEYLKRLFTEWWLRVGIVLDLLALVALYAIDVGHLWWVWPTLILAVALVGSGFRVFQDEREKSHDGVTIERLPAELGIDRAVLMPLPDAKIQIYAPIRFRLHNSHATNAARVRGARLMWWQSRHFMPARLIRSVPIVDVDHRGNPVLDVHLAAASSSREVEVLFDETWVDHAFPKPRRSQLVMELEILGAPNVRLPITDVVAKPEDWAHPNDWTRIIFNNS